MTTTSPPASTTDAGDPTRRTRTILAASMIGTTIEWYDFFLYATAAGLVFPGLFFPVGDAVVATILSFGTFAVGFVARPVGGIVFGHVGDRLGRKRTLVTTMVPMGGATTLIGVLPSYASIGIAAPVLLVVLRVLQGLAVGGEWGGAVLFAVENAPPRLRARYGAVPQIGAGLGLALGTGAFALLGETLDEHVFLTVGWRIAFLVSVALLVVGLVVRLRIVETAEFRALREREGTARVPAVAVFRDRGHRRGLAAGMLARWGEGAAFNTWGVFAITYATATVGMSRVVVLLAVTGGALLMAAMAPVAGWLADRYGRRRIFGIGVAGFGLTVVPSFAALGSGIPWLVVAVLLVQLGVWYGLITGSESTLLAELFDTGVRYTGMSLVFQGAGIWAAGLTPVVLTALLAADGGRPWWAAGYLAATAAVSVTAVALMPRWIGWRPEGTRATRW
jgi:MFS family permease